MSQHTRRRLPRRMVAVIGAAALMLMGLVGGSAAMADVPDNPVPGNIDPEATGELTIHKFGGDPVDGTRDDGTEIDDTSAFGTPLNGVEFTVSQVLHNGAPVDLTTSAAWNAIQGLTPAQVDASGSDWTRGTAQVESTLAGLANFEMGIGLYLVEETDPGNNEIVSPVVPFLVTIPYPSDGSWLYDVHVYPKNKLNETTPTKTVADPGHGVVTGSTITWTIDAPVPPLADGDTYDSFIITDPLDPRLSVDLDDVVVQLGTETLTVNTDYTLSEAAGLVTITLTGALGDLTGTDVVTVTLPTTVDGALTNIAEIANQANVRVNGTSKPTDEPAVFYGALTVNKHHAGNADNTLAGAMFDVYAADDSGEPTGDVLASGTTAADGTLSFPGLWVGTSSTDERNYVLVETQAPTGYILPADANFLVTLSVGNESAVHITVKDVPNTQQDGPSLPLTGSAGTAMFMAGGLALMLLAGGATLIATRKKQGQSIE